METMINEGPYQSISQDPTSIEALKIENICNKLTSAQRLTKTTAEMLNVKNPTPPIIYGTPKIHKPNVPLRPVVDFRNSPTYNMAKYLSQILKELAKGHKYTLKNSTKFIEEIRNIKLRPGDMKVSYDVVSLFTKVPIPETLIYIEKLLKKYKDLDKLTTLTVQDIMELLEICLSSTYFKYNGQYYRQKEGAAMGSPLSPIIAELFLQMLENSIIKNFRDIILWRRYVDDVIAIIRQRRNKKILQEINNFHPSIKFTIEEEKEGRLPFLDVMTYQKSDNSIGHHIYRKPTHTNQYLNYGSFHPQAHKIGVTDTLLTRAYKLSDEQHVNDEVNYTTQVLRQNGYPQRLINQRIQKMKYKITNGIKTVQDKEKRIILPWAEW
ncbi:uncharacterized protein LOC110862299 [Folsomia candida]|uniref:uncharacterized protein LOC110862299 n=1 Tax=Folsomia candida TaxID=158441 RepID=UPI001604F49E|nr:uncharacterized protein LOC110862299 [Folsomia candida]